MKKMLDELKEYLRIDGNDEDITLSTFLQTSISYLENAGVKQPSDYYLIVNEKEIFAQHRLAIMMLATHFYENRTTYYAIHNKNSSTANSLRLTVDDFAIKVGEPG